MVSERIPAVVVTGPVGAGKSTTVDAISTLLGELPLRHAVIDMDHLRRLSPNPENDRFGVQLGYRNLAAIWPNLLETGIRCAVLADVVETRAQVRDYEAAMPNAEVTVVRLHVDPEDLQLPVEAVGGPDLVLDVLSVVLGNFDIATTYDDLHETSR